MASDALRLLFELDVDSRSGTAGLLRFRKDIAATINATRRAVAQSVVLPTIKSPVSSASNKQVDDHVKAFRHIEREAAKSARVQEQEERRKNAVIAAADRQRVVAFTAQRKAEEKAAKAAAKAQEQAARQAAAAARKAFERQTQENRRSVESLDRQRVRERSAGVIRDLREQEKAAERTAKAFRDRFQTLGSIFDRLGQSVSSFGSRLTVAVTAPLAALAAVSVRSAISLDAQVNTLKAFTGGAEAAEQRLSKLIATAQRTPGLTTSLSLMLDSQLRLAEVTVETIDKVTPAIGRLNAVQKLQDPGKFSQNLVQLVTQNFERTDLKELVGQSPVAGQIIKEIFNVDSPTNAAAIRESAQRLGLTTTDAFFAAFAEAVERNPALANVTESLATRFEKLSDRVSIAFRPLGLAIIDAITPILNKVVPIIETVAQGFASLPGPVKTVIVILGGLAAATGPAAFLLGQMISTVGSLITTYGQLVAVGLKPSIEGFTLLTQVMRGNAALAAGQAATTAAAAGGWIALAGAVGLVIGVLAIVGIGIAGYIKSQKDASKVTAEQVNATKAQVDALQSQVKFLNGLKDGVKRTADEQQRLTEIYASLNTQGKIRVSGITDEEKRLAALREEIKRILQLRRDEQLQQAANLSAALASTTAQIQAADRSRESISTQIQVNTRLAESIQSSGRISADQARLLAAQLGTLGRNVGDVETAVTALNLRNEALIKEQTELIKTSKELTTKAEEQGAALAVLEKNGAGTAREFLSLAKQIGLFTGNVDEALASMERFIASQEKAANAADSFTAALKRQNDELLRAGKEADDAAKERNDIIKAAVSLAKEASNDLQGALKFLKAFIAANPDLRASIEKERQLAGKSLEDFLNDLLGLDRIGKNAGTALRNAQQQLADALLELTTANAEKRAAEEKAANEASLEANERSYALQLISYREYLEERARLTTENLDIERLQLTQTVLQARTAQKELLDAARRPGIPETESTKRRVQAAQQEEKAIRAATRLVELDARRVEIAEELKQSLSEAAIQQERDIRQLAVEFARLDDRIEDALNTETIEKFREQLAQLGKSQEFLNKELAKAQQSGNRDRQNEIESAQKLNQSQIDLIELITLQEFATNKLAAANEFVRRAKEKQDELERDLSFQVEFRGLKEEEAIKRRLEGERKLADSLRIVRDLVQAEVEALNAKGVKPPQALLDFIRETNAAIKGLGKLPFTEQFRLAQKEFDRINDLRLRKIEEVERAVRNRDIAELEGAIAIRRINGLYIGDLEKRLALLKLISDRSKDQALQQQAASARQAVNDTKDENEELRRQIESANANSTRSLFGDTFADFGEALRKAAERAGEAISGLTVALGSFAAAAAEHFANASASAGNFISILLDGIDQINAGLGDMLANWILTGDTGSAALRKLLASTLAYYSRTFLIKALDNIGEGFSNLAKAAAAAASGNLASAALYKAAAVQNFISAAKYGLASAATAVAGRLAAGDSFNQKDTARRAVNGGEDNEPRNRTLDGQTPVQSSSQATREGSGGFFGGVIARIEGLQQQTLEVQRQQMLLQGQTAQALGRIQSMRHGDALAIGAAENPAAVGQAVINTSNSDGEFNESLQRNLGFAR